MSPSGQFASMMRQLLERSEVPTFRPLTERLGGGGQRAAAGFLFRLAGLRSPAAPDEPGIIADFLREMVGRVKHEIDETAHRDRALRDALGSAGRRVASIEDVWAVTFPEAAGMQTAFDTAVTELRKQRRLEDVKPATDPIHDPLRQVLFTTNALVAGDGADYVYDHPIPLGAPAGETEIAHGLRLLDDAVAFELRRHGEWRGPLRIVMSVSATNRDDRGEAGAYVRKVIRETGPYPNLRVFVFDEPSVRALSDLIIAGHSSNVLGVAGPYGRHYSFLKAVGALWAVCIDRSIAATFKIDLDQSFPQQELVATMGDSAFETFTNPLWGGTALGSDGRRVDLGLIAGGLVNAADIEASIFAPDVVAAPPQTAEDVVFFSRLPQAVSTIAEIGAREDDLPIERFHVTGGVTGIRVDALRKWRLFTPSFVGRAEDQAFIISGLGGHESRPGYLHEPGLRMRHDKAELIPQVIAASAGSKHIGDLERIRLFSALGADHKELLGPFTGAFVSKLPLTVTTLRLATHGLALPADVAEDYFGEGVARLMRVDRLVGRIDDAVAAEKHDWARFYDSLDDLEAAMTAGSTAAKDRAAAISSLILAAEVD